MITDCACVVCGQTAPLPKSAGVCPACGDPFATLEINFDMDRVRASMTHEALAARPLNLWRYAELLPIEPDETAFAWPVGWTPILESPRLAAWAGAGVGAGRLRIKDDGRNPTGSFKDRASSVGVLRAMQVGDSHIACASTGNAASSLAGFAAMAGIEASIYVPRRAPKPKVAQLLIFGAHVKRVLGTYAQAYDLCNAQCDRHGWHNRNCAINPFLVEGKKTCGLEIAEQTARDLPDWVAISVGDGCTIAGVAKGLMQMQELGFIDRVPRVLGVQAAGVDPIAVAFETGALPTDLTGETMADSIDVPVPRNWRKAVDRVRACDGAFVRVTNDEIAGAMRAAGAMAGVFCEPAAAASIAGVKRAIESGVIDPGASVLAVSTGSGLKDVDSAIAIAGEPDDVPPLP